MKRRINKVIILSIIFFILILIYYNLNKKFNIKIPCLFHLITGLYCPGCGITRCIFSIMKGDLYKAFCYNKLVFILMPFFILILIYKIYLYIYNKKDKLICKIPFIFWIFLLIVVITFGILRNISLFLFLQPN